jgi:hypothetical protein
MTEEDEIYQIAQQIFPISDKKKNETFIALLTHFAKLIEQSAAAKEREACAKLCETEMRDWYASQNKTAQSKIMLYTAVYDCAAAIRARGQE